MAYVYLSKKDMAKKFRATLSRLELARHEIAFLAEGGFLNPAAVLEHLDEAIAEFKDEQYDASQKYGFMISLGIGPGDYKED